MQRAGRSGFGPYPGTLGAHREGSGQPILAAVIFGNIAVFL